MNIFDAYLEHIVHSLRNDLGIYTIFIEGSFGHDCPLFIGACDVHNCAMASILDNQKELVGYKGITIYKAFIDDIPIGVCLEQPTKELVSMIGEQKDLYGMPISQIHTEKNYTYIKFLL